MSTIWEPDVPNLPRPFQFTILTLILVTAAIAVFLSLLIQEAPTIVTVGYVFLVLIGGATWKQRRGFVISLFGLWLCVFGYKIWEAEKLREATEAWVPVLKSKHTEPIPKKYAKETAISLNFESRKKKDNNNIVNIRFINPTSLPVTFTGYSESSLWYDIQTWKNGKWVNGGGIGGGFCATGLRRCVIWSGQSSIIPVQVEDDLFPIRVGVGYSHGGTQKVVWSERIEKDSSRN